jgi:hypothetical protein
MIGKDKHRIMVTLTKEEMARAIDEAARLEMATGAYLASLVRDTWQMVDRHYPIKQSVTPAGSTD